MKLSVAALALLLSYSSSSSAFTPTQQRQQHSPHNNNNNKDIYKNAFLLSTTTTGTMGSSPTAGAARSFSYRKNSVAPRGMPVLATPVAEGGGGAVVDIKNFDNDDDEEGEMTLIPLTGYQDVKKLPYRQLHRQLRLRELPVTGSTADLRQRLLDQVCIGKEDAEECEVPEMAWDDTVGDFQDEAGDIPDILEFNDLLQGLMDQSSVGHWKGATRKLKKLKKTYATPEHPVPSEAYTAVLGACLLHRNQGARASVPARKILEDMAYEYHYSIPADMANRCVQNTLGSGKGATHDGFGGIDTALAMLAAIEAAPGEGSNMLTSETYEAVINALSRDFAVTEAVAMLKTMVVERAFKPSLETLALAAEQAVRRGKKYGPVVTEILTYVKAAGYELDSIASSKEGLSLLASGVIAAEYMDNPALGLRLLTAASKAEIMLEEEGGEERGDVLVANYSKAARRAATLIHKKAIDKCAVDEGWKVAVKLLKVMSERELNPSPALLRKVLTLCAKCKRSKKAAALLLDWVKLAEEGKVSKPPISVFNIVVNACERCDEQELTLLVLETMKKTHDTEGNVITFNIALKRLARLGNSRGCEGIIIGMLQAGVEPTVVSYTTAIGACANEPKDPAYAYEWLKRMRSRNVQPNFHTYNTALAACVDGKIESTKIASTIATEMLKDVEREMAEGLKGSAEYNSVIPDSYTKQLAVALVQQLRDNWRNGDIEAKEAKATVRVPLLELLDFKKHEEWLAKRAEKSKTSVKKKEDTTTAEGQRLDFEAVRTDHRTAEV